MKFKNKGKNVKKTKSFKEFFKPTIGKIVLTLIIILPFFIIGIYNLIARGYSGLDFLLYPYFPAMLISVAIAVILFKINIPIFYKIVKLECVPGTKCIEGYYSFTTAFYILNIIIGLFYCYIISCLIIFMYNKIKKDRV